MPRYSPVVYRWRQFWSDGQWTAELVPCVIQFDGWHIHPSLWHVLVKFLKYCLSDHNQ